MTVIGPYRLLRALGGCEAGEVWSAFAADGTSVTVAMIDPARAGDAAWLARWQVRAGELVRDGVLSVVGADLSAPRPWMACAWDGDIGAGRLFVAQGLSYRPIGPATQLPRAEPPAVPAAQQSVHVPEPLVVRVSEPEPVRPTNPAPAVPLVAPAWAPRRLIPETPPVISAAAPPPVPLAPSSVAPGAPSPAGIEVPAILPGDPRSGPVVARAPVVPREPETTDSPIAGRASAAPGAPQAPSAPGAPAPVPGPRPETVSLPVPPRESPTADVPTQPAWVAELPPHLRPRGRGRVIADPRARAIVGRTAVAGVGGQGQQPPVTTTPGPAEPPARGRRRPSRDRRRRRRWALALTLLLLAALGAAAGVLLAG